jgi:hypothetical protein
MINQIRCPIYSFIGITLMSLSLGGCIIHVNAKNKDWEKDSYSSNVTSTNKSVNVAEGRTVEDVGSVNGSVVVEDNVTAKHVTNINGRISIGNNVSVDSLDSVNGQIKVGESFVAKESVSAVNGQIVIQGQGKIGGRLTTVNGNILISSVVVEKDIVSTNGSVKLKDGSLVKGNIHFRNSAKHYNKNYPVLHISADSNVQGDIILERPVELDLQNKNLEGKIKRLYKD